MKNSIIFWNCVYLFLISIVLIFDIDMWIYILCVNSIAFLLLTLAAMAEDDFKYFENSFSIVFTNPLFYAVGIALVLVSIGKWVYENLIKKFNNFLNK